MRHNANQLRDYANVLASDGATVLTTGIACGVSDLSGRRLEQAQLISAETSHMILLRTADASALTVSSYIQCEGLLYIVDYLQDPREPRAGMWTEVYCHIERNN
jgi:hypothetical protein